MSSPLLVRLALGAAALAILPSGRAFDLIGSAWADGNIVMQLQLGTPSTPLIDGSADWATVAESALNEWNQHLVRSKFTVVRDSTAAIARGNRINNVTFRNDIYGEAFDSRTLAVTLGSSSNTTGASTEKDVIFNSNRTWNSYRGSLRSGTTEFRRVALHEFGHVLGLDHPDQASAHFQSVNAIMDSTVSSLETVQSDDIAGVRALYDSAATRTLAASETFTLTVPTAGASPYIYTWYFRPANAAYLETIKAATGATYTIGSVQPADAGTYIATVTGQVGEFSSTTVILAANTVTSSADTMISNLSTRGVVGTGNSVLIAGIVIGGTTAKNVLIRAAGPALSDFGVATALGDPTLSLLDGQNRIVAQNDNWETGNDVAAVTGTSTRLGAFQFKRGSRDAAVLTTLAPGSYTAIVNGVNNATGVALVEAYDADPDPATARTRKLVNIATRGQVNGGEDVLIAGLVVSGSGPKTFLIRGVGITLANAPFNVSGALRDPLLQVYQGDRLLRENDDWDSPLPYMATLRSAAAQVGAFALQERRSNSGLDSVMLMTLQPGSYTAKLSGFEGQTGVGLIEIYEMP